MKIEIELSIDALKFVLHGIDTQIEALNKDKEFAKNYPVAELRGIKHKINDYVKSELLETEK